MGLYYPRTEPFTLIGSKSGTTRTGITLESTYQAESATVATKTFETSGYSKLNLDFNYTMGSAETSNSLEVKVESSPDGTNFYRIANDDTTAGTSTLTAREFTFVGADGAASPISIFIDIAYRYLRVSCKETGVASNKGNVYVEATLAGK